MVSLPPAMGQLTSLTELNLRKNNLEDVPAELALCKRLQTLGLYTWHVCDEIVPIQTNALSVLVVAVVNYEYADSC